MALLPDASGSLTRLPVPVCIPESSRADTHGAKATTLNLQSDLMEWLDLVQWPAFAASLVAAYLVASNNQRRRNLGFWVFLLSNALWVVWGIHTHAWALIALQIGLAGLNVRGLFKTER